MLSECKANKSKGIKIMIYFYAIVVSVSEKCVIAGAGRRSSCCSQQTWLIIILKYEIAILQTAPYN